MVELFRFYEDRGLVLVKGYMQYVWDSNDRRYIDLHTGHGVAFLGHSHPRLKDELSAQASRLATCSLSFRCPIQDEALDALDKITPKGMDSVMLFNSGSEAVEAALKTTWAYTGRRKIVALKGSFHGRTLGSLSVTWNPKYRNGFPVMSEVVFIKDVSDAENVVDSNTAAVIIEPIQGEGGVIPLSSDLVKVLYERIKAVDGLFIVDEVQTGFGRTGALWAYSYYNVKPDILVAGKSIGSGFPVGAVFSHREYLNSLKGGRHGSTFGGNPLALAAVKASIETLLSDDAVTKANMAGSSFMDMLIKKVQQLRPVREIRGRGLMLGVDLRFPPSRVLNCLQEKGILALKAGVTVVRFLPPYMIGHEDMEVVVDGLRECICGEHGC
ncbi:MAG: aspartate aminotransferase family protein [Desulfurococcales archaeon]|nr:aspartate aminotransferase family protein [Desulfurococcales archaeon]